MTLAVIGVGNVLHRERDLSYRRKLQLTAVERFSKKFNATCVMIAGVIITCMRLSCEKCYQNDEIIALVSSLNLF